MHNNAKTVAVAAGSNNKKKKTWKYVSLGTEMICSIALKPQSDTEWEIEGERNIWEMKS